MTTDLVESITQKRAEATSREVRAVYPDATVSIEVSGERGIITAYQERYVLSKEFVESESSLRNPRLLVEYAHVLQAKSRLVVLVPRDRAAAVRLRLLELNNWWLCYYQLHYYEEGGGIKMIDRRTFRRLMGLPPDDPPRGIEVA
ncbi:MAG: hypothetical protein ISF22_07295 [Methanomassiliicoccus sp.]|nr:hypothetical protein [Methanomassiliicoccus sp.]